MDLDVLKFLLPAALSVGSLGWSILAYRLGVRKAQLADLKKEIGQVAADLVAEKEAGSTSRASVLGRLVRVEETLTQMPDKDTVHKLALDVSEMRGDVRVQGESLKAIGATAHRVEAFLLDGARSRQG